MTKFLRCHDIFPGCTAEVRADSEEEILRQAAEHAVSEHGVKKIAEATIQSVKAKIRSA